MGWNTAFQSTGPSRGPTGEKVLPWELTKDISIHRPLAGPDCTGSPSGSECSHFNPQAPRGARRDLVPDPVGQLRISIHRPLAGPDDPLAYTPRIFGLFQSTGPSRGPTPALFHNSQEEQFQSTGPSRGPTRAIFTAKRTYRFQSTGPSRGPTLPRVPQQRAPQISIHRPLAGPDGQVLQSVHDGVISIHRPLAGPDGVPPL